MAVINDNTSFLVTLKIILGDLATDIGDDVLNIAIDSANAELGWAYPFDLIKSDWALRRGKRHAIYWYLHVPAQDFKAKQYNLEQVWEHFRDMIKDEDIQFAIAQENDPALFGNVDITQAFGTVIGTGSVYDVNGKDIGYWTPSYDFIPRKS